MKWNVGGFSRQKRNTGAQPMGLGIRRTVEYFQKISLRNLIPRPRPIQKTRFVAAKVFFKRSIIGSKAAGEPAVA